MLTLLALLALYIYGHVRIYTYIHLFENTQYKHASTCFTCPKCYLLYLLYLPSALLALLALFTRATHRANSPWGATTDCPPIATSLPSYSSSIPAPCRMPAFSLYSLQKLKIKKVPRLQERQVALRY